MNIEKLNAVMYETIDDADELHPFYTVEKDAGEFCLFVNVKDEKYPIYTAKTTDQLSVYIDGMIRGLKVERKPVWMT